MSTADARATTIGPAGRAVCVNIEELRKERGLSFRDLSAKLSALGRPIPPSMLHVLSKGGRRVDADDLLAFAEVFGVTPARLLARAETAASEDHPAVRAARALADRLAEFGAAADPEAVDRIRSQAERALRRVQLEAEELLDT